MTDSETQEEQKAQDEAWAPRHAVGLATVGLALGLAAERLFYGRSLGISFPVWSAAFALALLAWARRENRDLDGLAVGVLAAAAVHSWIVFLRTEPLTSFLGVTVTFGLFLLALRALRPGRLLDWGWLDMLLAAVWVPFEGWFRPWQTLGEAQRWATKEQQGASLALAILRGLLLALPAVALFLVLLSAADPIFEGLVEDFIEWLNLERILDWIARGFYVLLVGAYAVGLIVAALRRGREEELVRGGEPLVKPFLGLVEAGVVLASVDLIFGIFVAVQLRYFFGGEANISETGFTYAEYARRGFGELVAVSFLSLGLILALGAVTRRGDRSRRWIFNGMCTGLVSLTGVMLLSALQRLMLYEQAYGFTRLRTYTHLAIWWLAILFLAFLSLLYARRLERFVQVMALGAVGFSVALAALNVDALIVRRNFEHQESIGELDPRYLTGLSMDSVPELVARLASVGEEDKPTVLAGLSCHLFQLEMREEEGGWPSYRLPHDRARRALTTIQSELKDYLVELESGPYGVIEVREEEPFYCSSMIY